MVVGYAQTCHTWGVIGTLEIASSRPHIAANGTPRCVPYLRNDKRTHRGGCIMGNFTTLPSRSTRFHTSRSSQLLCRHRTVTYSVCQISTYATHIRFALRLPLPSRQAVDTARLTHTWSTLRAFIKTCATVKQRLSRTYGASATRSSSVSSVPS